MRSGAGCGVVEEERSEEAKRGFAARKLWRKLAPVDPFLPIRTLKSRFDFVK